MLKFFKNFNKKHKIAADIVDEIQKLCQTLGDGLKKVSDNICKGHPKDVECLIAEWMELFDTSHGDLTKDLLPSFESAVNSLLSMVDDLRDKVHWDCQNGKACTCSCEAKLNGLGCDLNESCDQLKEAGSIVFGYVASLLEYCSKLKEIVDKFDCTHHPICKKSGDKYKSGKKDKCCEANRGNIDWVADVEAFINSINLDAPAAVIKSMDEVCDSTNESIKVWLKRLKY